MLSLAYTIECGATTFCCSVRYVDLGDRLMTLPEDEATFNLKAVVRETGVKPDTLRAWERRYGLPQPERTSGGHRIYSRRDIDTVRWLAARQEEGLTIRHAIGLWRQYQDAGRDPLLAMPLPGGSSGQAMATASRTTGRQADTIEGWRQRWIDACLAFEEPAAEQTLNQAFALFSPERVCLDVLQAGLAEIGQGWYEGRVTVQQEHFASALATRRLDALLLGAPPPSRPGRILVGCPPDERHTFSPLLLTFLLRRQGWDALFLGVDVPAQQLVGTLEDTGARLLILSAQQLTTAAALKSLAKAVADVSATIAYGGLVFNLLPDIREYIPGHYLGPALADAPERVAALLRLASGVLPAREPSRQSREALDAFDAASPLIDADAWRACATVGIAPATLGRANKNMAANIRAALAFGDIDLAGADLAWLEGLLFNYQVSVEVLTHYLAAYADAAADHLDERGEPIVTWLQSFTAAGHGAGTRSVPQHERV